jgi:hypothetical protein
LQSSEIEILKELYNSVPSKIYWHNPLKLYLIMTSFIGSIMHRVRKYTVYKKKWLVYRILYQKSGTKSLIQSVIHSVIIYNRSKTVRTIQSYDMHFIRADMLP